MDLSKLTYGFLWFVTWICQYWFMDSSEFLHGFVKFDLWISQCCYVDLWKVLLVFLFVTRISQSCYKDFFKLLDEFVNIEKWISLICYMDLSKLRHGFLKFITFSRFLHGFVKVTTHGFIKVSILDDSNGVKGNCFMPHRKYLSLWEKIFAKLYWEMWENPTAELLGNIFAQLAIFVIPLLKCSLHPLKDTEKHWKYWKITNGNICDPAFEVLLASSEFVLLSVCNLFGNIIGKWC